MTIDVTMLADGSKRLFITGETQWLDPGDWNNDENMIEGIGAGGQAGWTNLPNRAAGGGGGGAYAVWSNVIVRSFPVPVSAPSVGTTAASANNATFVCGLIAWQEFLAEGGRQGQQGNIGRGEGGQATNCRPTAGARSGGHGGTGTSAGAMQPAGGGGAASPTSDGGRGQGAAYETEVPGSAGGTASGGWPGYAAGAGGWGGAQNGFAYGGGAGGSPPGWGSSGFTGGPALLVITYNPTVRPVIMVLG